MKILARRPWLLCLPAIFVLFLIAGYPLLRTVFYSLTQASLSNLDHPNWNNFENYFYLLKDPDWWTSVKNTLIFTVFSVTLETIFGVAVALLLNTNIKAKGIVRASVLVPWAIPAVVSARIWSWIFNDLYGIANHLLEQLGVIQNQIAWFSNPTTSRFVIILVDVWKTTPFMALILLAGLQNIPNSVYEAAEVDGASSWQRFFYITLPLLKPALWVAVLFRTLDALRIFDLPFVLTSNSRSSAVVSIYARQQMVDFQDVGLGSAASVLIFIITSSIAVIYFVSGRKNMGLES